MPSRSRPDPADPMGSRSRSSTSVSKGSQRPRSRGSTASIHSSTTQQTQDQHLTEGFPPSIPARTDQSQHMFNTNPEEMIIRFGQRLANSTNDTLDPSIQEAHNATLPRPGVFQGHSFQSHSLDHNSMTPEMAVHGLPTIPIPQYTTMYEGSIDASMPDRALEDNENSETGTRKKRGSSSTVANDNELRKLLRQYDGYTLTQMAVEVQKHEGSGGKSEKVKQVFAMIWLRENCKKNNGSVRRDRVYCCYAEKCGTERVSVLNPASFGKLVRIIFPNVQTRRLGVRGESKYHYVDLSVIEEKQQRQSLASAIYDQPRVSAAATNLDGNTVEPARSRSLSNVQPPMDTAVFPSPTTCFPQKIPLSSFSLGCSCETSVRPCFDGIVTLDNVASQSVKMIRHMLHFPSNEPSAGDNSLQLPDVRPYLPGNTDLKVADALTALYRTHCISVIDSFRYCKERNLFRHFSAFHGTLTVPVQKLLAHPNLSPWIKECDWLMYQKMIEFVVPLTTQVVPKPVLDAFGSISQRLTVHISETSKAQPVHVSLARLVPAHIFCNLLKHMLDVNQSANAAAAWLCHSDNRNQMWLDFAAYVNPKEMISRANVPSCAEQTTEQILKHDVQALLTPLDDTRHLSLQSFFQQSDSREDQNAHKFLVDFAVGGEYNFPDKWVSFILNLPAIFPHHRAQCVVDKVDALWDCILHRLTLAGAQSFSAWWITKVFFHEMLLWLVEKGGFMKHTPSTVHAISLTCEPIEFNNLNDRHSDNLALMMTESSVAPNTGSEANKEDNDAAMVDEDICEGSMEQSSSKANPTETNRIDREQATPLADGIGNLQGPNNDDSAIDLDEPVLVSVSKYGDIIASDMADPDGDVVVI